MSQITTIYIWVKTTILMIGICFFPILLKAQCVAPRSNINFSNTGQNSSPGFNTVYVLTNANGDILQTNLSSPFSAPAGAGSYKVYAINYEGTAPSAMVVGNNISTLTGTCFTISSPPASFCVNEECVAPRSNINFSNTGQNSSPGFNIVYVLTDANGGILQINLSSPFSAPASAGSYKVYAINYEGSAPSAMAVGNNISTLTGTCFAISSLPASFCVNDECVAPNTSIGFTSAGYNNDTDHSTAYVLVDNANNQIIQQVTSPFNAPSAQGSYSVYVLNWLNTETAPVLTPGTNINSTGGKCLAQNSILFSVCNILPVTLLSFDVSTNNCTAVLKWVSATETSFKEYQAEHSTDGVTYSLIKTIPAKGDNTSYTISYPAQKGRGYYRLKIVDRDGSFKYSTVGTSNIDCNKPTVLIYPNPAKELLNVDLGNINGKGTATLFDGTGRVILTQVVTNGKNKLNVAALPPGIYTLNIATTGRDENHKIAISRGK